MQDAAFIESNGEKYGKLRSDNANKRRSRDSASETKSHEKHFGYKPHTLVGEIKIIE